MNLLSVVKNLPVPKPLSLAWRAIRNLTNNDGIEIAGFIAYTGLVSLFPFTIFLFSLAGFAGQTKLAEEFLVLFFTYMPDEVADTLSPILTEILGKQRGGLLTIGIIGTLWVTSSGVEALRMGLNRAYRLKETRPIWRRRALSALFVISGAASVLTATFLIVTGPVILQVVSKYTYLPLDAIWAAQIVRYPLAAGLLMAFMCVLYRFLPNALYRWRSVVPGAVLTVILWLTLASLFSLYLAHAGSYSVTYGSLGGVVITLLFLHISSLIFILGAEVNALLLKDKQQLHSENEAPQLQNLPQTSPDWRG